MAKDNGQKGMVLSYIWACLAVGLLLLGRWSPDRLFASQSTDVFWIVKVAALLVMTFIVIGPRTTLVTHRISSMGSFAALMTYVFTSYLWNNLWLPYADSKLADLVYNIVLVLVVAAGLKQMLLREKFWEILVGALGLMALIGIVTLPTAIANSEDGRLSVLGGGPNIFGRNMGILTVACLFFGLNVPKLRVGCAILAGIAFIGIIASGSRGALGATLAGAAALFVFDQASRQFVLRRPLIILSFLAVGGLALFLADWSSVAAVGNERFVEQTLETGYLSSRDILFDWAYAFWLEAPIFGNGLGSFAAVTDLEYPHNILMEFLCETGVVGLLLFLLFSGLSFLRQFRMGGQERSLILSVTILLLVAAMVSGDFVDSRLLFLFLLYPIVDPLRNNIVQQRSATGHAMNA